MGADELELGLPQLGVQLKDGNSVIWVLPGIHRNTPASNSIQFGRGGRGFKHPRMKNPKNILFTA
jgi:hypothetical protein